MYRLYQKNELNFSLVWIAAYIILFSTADNFSASLGFGKKYLPRRQVFSLCCLFSAL